jgi:hypothetical protein
MLHRSHRTIKAVVTGGTPDHSCRFVAERLTRPRERHRRDELRPRNLRRSTARREADYSSPGLEGADHGPIISRQGREKSVMLNSAVQRGQPSSTVVAARFDEVIARVRDIDRYQHGVIRDRLSVGPVAPQWGFAHCHSRGQMTDQPRLPRAARARCLRAARAARSAFALPFLGRYSLSSSLEMCVTRWGGSASKRFISSLGALGRRLLRELQLSETNCSTRNLHDTERCPDR